MAAVFAVAAANVGAMLGGLWKLQRVASHVERTFDYFAREHEMLMQDYAERHGITLEALPTRLKRAPWWSNE